MLPNFSYIRPGSLAEAIAQLSSDGAVLHAGGTDLLGCLRDGVFTARKVVSITGIDDLRTVAETREAGLGIAGKSSLLNVIAGVYLPTQGSIFIDGVNVTRWPEYQRATLVGRVFQNPLLGTAASMTIAQNLTLALLRGKPLHMRSGVTQERKALFRQLLTPLGMELEDRLDVRVSSLSGGQRQALTLLIATLTRPKILLLDEHAAALDPAKAAKVLDLTRQLVTEHKLTTLMVTHIMGLLIDIFSVLGNEKVNVIATNTLSEKRNHTARVDVTLEISDIDQLSRGLNRISQLPNIMEVRRRH